MIKDITLGQYYQDDSIIHRLDPRVKIISSLVYLVCLFVVKNFYGFIWCALVLGIVISLSKVPVSFIMRGLKPILLILCFTFMLNIFLVEGEILWQWWKIKITREGIQTAIFMAIRLILLIMGSSMLTLTTKPLNLTDGLERLFSPLKAIGVPSHEIAMMMTIALRFIPTLLDETNKIMKAQMARGADFESGKLIKRIKSLIPVLVPLFISAFRIAQDLALAMEARCYRGGVGRTRMNEMKFKTRDYISFVLNLVFISGVVLVNILL